MKRTDVIVILRDKIKFQENYLKRLKNNLKRAKKTGAIYFCDEWALSLIAGHTHN